MKAFLVFILLSVSTVYASNGQIQNIILNLNVKNQPVETVLKQIEQKSGYSFFYNTKQVDAKRRISLKAVNKNITGVLDEIFEGTHVKYSLVDKSIILSYRPDESSSQTGQVQAKNKTVSGTIKDANGEPLIGVNVFVKGTTTGATTDMNGNFSLKAHAGQTLVATFVGYKTEEIIIGSSAVYNIVMSDANISLDAVVVTALGIKRSEKALSYNVQEIKNSELTGIKDINFMNSLSGKVAGVNINTSSAGVGGATRVVMRGTKSITKDNNALYVIDGVPIFNSNNGGLDMNNEYANQPRGEGIADLNPEDIESMTVLTGPAAAALYGSNAANGAIIITTKKGLTGKPKVIISNQTTFSRPFILPDFQNRYGNKSGEYRSWGDKQNVYSFKPSNFFDTGATLQTTASLSVGSDKNQTYMSLGSTSANGIIPENEYSKSNVTLRNTTHFLNDKFILDFGFSYIRQKDRNMMAQGKYYNPLTAVYTFPRGENFNDVNKYEVYDKVSGYNLQQWKWSDQGLDMQNPYWIINRNVLTNKRDRYMMNVNLQYTILNWLNVMGRARLDNSVNDLEQKNYASTNQLFASVNGRYRTIRENMKQGYVDLLLNLNKSWNDYSFSANVGTSISDMRSDSKGIDGAALMIPNFFSMTNIDKAAPKTKLMQDGWHEQTQSIFANIELGWNGMLYLTVTGRNDWASALANTKSNSFFYPSVGLSGVVSEMAKMPEWISYLKIRGSYSSVGSAIPRNLSIATYKFDEQGGVWQTNTFKPIDDLKAERTGAWEAGISSKLWGDRLSFDFTWYKSNTKNQTLQIPMSSSSGYSSMYIQTGNVENKGMEITLGVHNRWNDFLWSSVFTAGFNQNRIIQLMEENKFFDTSGKPILLESISQGGIGASEFRLTKGGTMGDLWTKTKLKFNDDGSVFLNTNGNPVMENTLEKAGSVLPKWNLGFRNNFKWKDIDLGFMFAARLGGIVISPTQAILDGFGVSETTAVARDNNGVKIGSTTIDPYKYYSVTGQASGLLADYVYRATNVRLQELSLGYTLPKKWFNDIVNVHLAFVGHNLWMLYNKAPFDPEATASTGTYFQGIDYFMQPSLRNLGFNLRLEF